MLNLTGRVYRRTEAGVKALQSPSSVPQWYRALLDLIPGETLCSVICAGMSTHPEKQVLDWLDEMETLGFVELTAFASSSPLPDTTGNFSFLSTRDPDRPVV